ncbi:MAG: undecaprenyl-diphosphate phosphatase [Pseudomonadota bacterium]
MEMIQIIWLAIVQGLTEFLPISSSAHLILVPPLVGWPDQGLEFDVAVHLGTLSAVMLYFRDEIGRMLVAWLGSLSGDDSSPDSRLAWGVIIGTIPVCIAGLLLKDIVELYLRSPLVIAVTTVVFGLLLWLADTFGTRHRAISEMRWSHYLFIGVAQAVALVPGTSRSGITITAALFMGFERDVAARFSFLLSIPVILLSSAFVTADLIAADDAVDWFALAMGTLISGVCAFLCIHYFLIWIQRMGMLPFVIYRLLLGLFLFYIFWP